jgi:hypothetical protein
MDNLAKKTIRYAESKGWYIDRKPGAVNIFYGEGMNADGSRNADKDDEFNDLRYVILFNEKGEPYCDLIATATTEPGRKSTLSKQAKKLGGVGRIQFGQFRVWKMGYHKSDKKHPALVQRGELLVCRDKNMDGKRTGDAISRVTGLNQHGIILKSGQPLPKKVGLFSAACLVGLYWSLHLNFIDLCKKDPNYIADKKYLFYTAIINGDEFAKFA